MTHDKTLTEAGAMTIPEVVGIRRQLSAALARADAALARVKAAEAERDAALARYEAAEAEVAQWRGFVTAIQERLQVALARVAELEAAQGWRPVTEKPGKEVENGEQGALCLLRSFTKLYGYGYKLATWHSFIVKVWPGVSEEVPGGYWLSADDDGDEIDIDDWQEWQLLRRFPTPPAAATQEPTP